MQMFANLHTLQACATHTQHVSRMHILIGRHLMVGFILDRIE